MSFIIAFLAGMLTLLSPCTLPVIPLVFASVRGKKGQMVALLVGMVLVFTVVSLLISLASSWVVQVTQAGRWLALLFLAMTAVTLLSTRAAQVITAPLTQLGNRINDASNRRSGLAAALLAGLAVTTRLRQGAGVLMLASVALLASGRQGVLQPGPQLAQNLEQRLSHFLPASAPKITPLPVVEQTQSGFPGLEGGTAWFNSVPLNRADLKGKVVLIDFWTYDCINCQHTLPHVRDWAKKYQAEGLTVIGVHTPEYPWERDPAAVARAIKQWGLPYPVVADNHYAIWNRFGNRYWPAHYIFDAHGQLRYTAFGEGDYAGQEKVIQQLLQEAKA